MAFDVRREFCNALTAAAARDFLRRADAHIAETLFIRRPGAADEGWYARYRREVETQARARRAPEMTAQQRYWPIRWRLR